MPEPAQPRGRPRSNSLQRMLELEKKFLLQRLVASGPRNVSQPSSGSHHSHARQADFVCQKESRKNMTPSRYNSAVPPPLVINTSARGLHHPQPIAVPAMPQRRDSSEMESPWNVSTGTSTPDKPGHKNVAFMFPPDVDEQRSSLCQSPSWEAYGRRKKEKKEEKKEKEQALKDAKPRKRRLSKPRPAAPEAALATGDRTVSDSVVPRRNLQPKPRPSSVLGIIGLERSQEPEAPKRGRSGSLTSTIKASFEIRRASFDRTKDTGFIGGIKLEQQRQEFTQQVLEDQAKTDSKVHPALRKSFLGHGPFTPLKPPSSPRKNSADPQRRAYPPISMQTASGRSSSVPSPSTPTMSDFGRFWHGRGGRRASDQGSLDAEDSCAIVDDSEDQAEPKNMKSASSDRILEAGGRGLARKGGLYIKTSPTMPSAQKYTSGVQLPNASGDKPPSSSALQKMKPTHFPGASVTAPLTKTTQTQPRERHMGGQIHNKPELVVSSDVEPSSPPPPEPPRKSSKRASMVMANRFLPSSHSDTSMGSHTPGQHSPSKDFFGTYTPPNLELKPNLDLKPALDAKPTMDLKPALDLQPNLDSNPPVEVQRPREPPSQASPQVPHDDPEPLLSPPNIPYASAHVDTRHSSRMSIDSTSSNHHRWSWRDATKAVFGRAHGHSSQLSLDLLSGAGSSSYKEEPSHFARHPKKEGAPAIAVSGVQAINGHQSPKLAPYQHHNNLRIPHTTASRRPCLSSSDDSSSDEFPSSTPMSTPDTSRPQSEKEHPTNVSKPVRPVHHKAQTSAHLPRTALSEHFYATVTREERRQSQLLDPIEVAAKKFMDAFPDVDLPRRSIDRSRSDTNLATDTDFLPKLKHQPLKLNDNGKLSKFSMAPEPPEDLSSSPSLREVLMARDESSSAAPWPATYLEAARKAAPNQNSRNTKPQHTSSQSVPFIKDLGSPSPRPQSSVASSPEVTPKSHHHSSSSVNHQTGDPIAKMFVECCGCKYYHDMPSKIYEAMANPDGMLGPEQETGSFAGRVSMTVRCPWCKHEMSTKCCAGLAAMVYIKERLH